MSGFLTAHFKDNATLEITLNHLCVQFLSLRHVLVTKTAELIIPFV